MEKKFNKDVMTNLVITLNKYSDAYYNHDTSLVSDKEYDALYDQLLVMERESGVVLPDSPTQRPGGTVIDSLQKVQHSKPCFLQPRPRMSKPSRRSSTQAMSLGTRLRAR